MYTKALGFVLAAVAGALSAGSAYAQVVTISPGYGYASSYGYPYTPPAYGAPAPAYGLAAPSVTIVISPPAANYVAPGVPAYTAPSYAAPPYAYEAAPVPPAPIPTPSYGYLAPAPTYEAPAYADETDYVDPGYAYTPTTRYVRRGYASSTTRVCWHDSFGVRRCR